MEYMLLKEVCDIRDGTHNSPKYVQSGYPLVTSEEDYNKINERSKVDIGDIIMPMIGTIGNPIIIADFCDFAIKNVALIKFPNKNVYNRYIWYFLKSTAFKRYIKEKNKGGTQKFLSLGDIRNIQVPLISFSKQIELIEKLDLINDIISLRKKELLLLDNIIKARFVEMFGNLDVNPHGWNKSLLSNVILNANNGMSRRGDDKYGNIVMRLIELQEGFIDYSRPNRIMLKDHEKKRYLLKEEDVLFARVNGNPNNVGRCAVFYDIDEDVYHNDHIIRVHFDEKILDAIFASTVLNSDYGKRQLMGKVKTSAGQYTVSQDGIGSILIALPPIEMQQEFTTFVKEVNKSKLV